MSRTKIKMNIISFYTLCALQFTIYIIGAIIGYLYNRLCQNFFNIHKICIYTPEN